ncbi:MAG: RES family NAD+ phosphorylase [Chloroflexota bacterium]
MASTAQPSGSRPGPHPDPPADLAQRQLPLVQISSDTPFFRIHAVDQGALHFSHSGIGRFDAPGGEYGIVYLGRDFHCAFIETFGRDLAYRLVTRAELAARGLAHVFAGRPVRLVDLTGPGLAGLGADALQTYQFGYVDST